MNCLLHPITPVIAPTDDHGCLWQETSDGSADIADLSRETQCHIPHPVICIVIL